MEHGKIFGIAAIKNTEEVKKIPADRDNVEGHIVIILWLLAHIF